MILNDQNIEQWCLNNNMIEPFNPMLVNPASYDLTLHYELIEITPGGVMDSSNSGNATRRLISERKIKLSYGQSYLLQPGIFILASSVEYVRIPHTLAAEVKLKSTTARKGIGHVYSGWIDPGFMGNITFELFSHVPVLLEPGKPIAQIIFNEMLSVPQKPYQGKYQHQQGPTPARSEFKDQYPILDNIKKGLAPSLEYISATELMGSTPVLKQEFNKAFSNITDSSVDRVWSDAEGNVHVKEPNNGKEYVLTIVAIQQNWERGIHPAQTVAEFVNSITNPRTADDMIQEVIDAVREDFGPAQEDQQYPNSEKHKRIEDGWAKRPLPKLNRDWAEEE